MYAVSAEHLVLDNHFVCSSLEKKISSTLSISCLPVTLFVGFRPCGLPHFHTVKSLGLVFFQFTIGQSYSFCILFTSHCFPSSLTSRSLPPPPFYHTCASSLTPFRRGKASAFPGLKFN